MDSFCESMDSFCFVITNPDSKKVRFVPYKMNPGFVSYRGSRILTLKDAFQILSHESSQFSKICLFLRIQRILSTIARNESLKIEIRESESYESLSFGFANPDSRIQTLKIRIVDLICRSVFERFVSWKQKSQITRFVSFRKNLYTNPASLFKICQLHLSIAHFWFIKITDFNWIYTFLVHWFFCFILTIQLLLYNSLNLKFIALSLIFLAYWFFQFHLDNLAYVLFCFVCFVPYCNLLKGGHAKSFLLSAANERTTLRFSISDEKRKTKKGVSLLIISPAPNANFTVIKNQHKSL
jgi:hypothetical protein